MTNFLKSLLQHYALPLAAVAWLTLEPVHTSVVAVLALPLIDLILALLVARKTKQPVTSAGMKRTVAKILVYETATLLAFVVETYLTGPVVPACRIVTGLTGLTELKSCLEHLDELSGTNLLAAAIAKLAPEQPNDKDPNP